MRRFALALLGALVVAAGASAAVLPGFRSPSGNIHCAYASPALDRRNTGGLYCWIDHARYAASLRRSCGRFDWHGWTLGSRSRAQINCSGGALWFGTPAPLTLAYGRTWRAGPYACRSARTGVTCTNRGGHGLVVSRASWRAW